MSERLVSIVQAPAGWRDPLQGARRDRGALLGEHAGRDCGRRDTAGRVFVRARGGVRGRREASAEALLGDRHGTTVFPGAGWWSCTATVAPARRRSGSTRPSPVRGQRLARAEGPAPCGCSGRERRAAREVPREAPPRSSTAGTGPTWTADCRSRAAVVAVHVRRRWHRASSSPDPRARNRRPVRRPVQRLGVEGGGTPAEIQAFVDLLEQVRPSRPSARARADPPREQGGRRLGRLGGRTDTLATSQARGNGHTAIVWGKARWASELHGTTWKLNWRDGESFELDEATRQVNRRTCSRPKA